MDNATQAELTALATDHAIVAFDMSDAEAASYANMLVKVYDCCLRGTLDQVQRNMTRSVPEYLAVLAELGYDTRNRREVSETIVDQLGGIGRLCAMVGVSRNAGILFGDYTTTIRFRGCRKFDRVAITLDPGSDTYSVKFMKLNRPPFEITREDETTGVHANQLVTLFTFKTGLALSL